MERRLFTKSLEEDLTTKQVREGEKHDHQSIEDMVETGQITPNTKSFNRPDRLATTHLAGGYTTTYRPQGVIFETHENPDFAAPFDLMAVAAVNPNEMTADYYAMVKNLGEHYGRHLIPGYERFLFDTVEEMHSLYPSPDVTAIAVNTFRQEHGFDPIEKDAERFFAYNEVGFERPISISPIAIYNEKGIESINRRAKELGLPLFRSARHFLESLK